MYLILQVVSLPQLGYNYLNFFYEAIKPNCRQQRCNKKYTATNTQIIVLWTNTTMTYEVEQDEQNDEQEMGEMEQQQKHCPSTHLDQHNNQPHLEEEKEKD